MGSVLLIPATKSPRPEKHNFFRATASFCPESGLPSSSICAVGNLVSTMFSIELTENFPFFRYHDTDMFKVLLISRPLTLQAASRDTSAGVNGPTSRNSDRDES